jgi:hypothetical protein
MHMQTNFIHYDLFSLNLYGYIISKINYIINKRGCRGCDSMVVGFTTTCEISTYHYWSCEFQSPKKYWEKKWWNMKS